MKKEKAFKAYFITCSLLEQFEGICSMIAEEELFYLSLDLVNGKVTDYYFIEMTEFTFGLSKKNLKKALKQYEEYKNEI